MASLGMQIPRQARESENARACTCRKGHVTRADSSSGQVPLRPSPPPPAHGIGERARGGGGTCIPLRRLISTVIYNNDYQLQQLIASYRPGETYREHWSRGRGDKSVNKKTVADRALAVGTSEKYRGVGGGEYESRCCECGNAW